MAAIGVLVPARLFAPCRPLSWHPPAADLPRLLRLLQIHDQHDGADEAFQRRREVGVATVEIEAVYALADGGRASDLARIGLVDDVVDLKVYIIVGRQR